MVAMSISHRIVAAIAVSLIACGTAAAPASSDPSTTTVVGGSPLSSAAPVKGSGTAPKTCGGKIPEGGKRCSGDLRFGSGIPGHAPLRGLLRLEGTVPVVQLESCTCFGGTSNIPETDHVALAHVPKGMIDPSLFGKAVVVEWDMATGPSAASAERGESGDVFVTAISVNAASR